MIKINYAIMASQEFVTTLSQFKKTVKLPMSVSLKVVKLIDAIDSEINTAKKHFVELLKDYCELDENGNVKTEEDEETKQRMYVFKSEEGKAEYGKKMNELLQTEAEFDFPKLTEEDLKDAMIEPEMIQRLRPLFDI